jgi:parallel beta-helix repeat protein
MRGIRRTSSLSTWPAGVRRALAMATGVGIAGLSTAGFIFAPSSTKPITLSTTATEVPLPNGYTDASGFASLNAAVSAAQNSAIHGVWIPAGFTSHLTGGTATIPSGLTIVGENPTTSVVNGGTLAADSANNIDLSNFTINGMPSGAMAVRLGASSSTVDHVSATGGDFIMIQVFGSGNTVSNNSITSSSPWYGYDVSGSNDHVVGNSVTGLNGSAAYGFHSVGLQNSTIERNTVDGVSHYGVYLDTSSGVVVSGNSIKNIGHVNGQLVDPSGTGVDTVGGTGNLFVGNTITGVEGYTIVMSAQESGSVISGNTLETNSDPAITLNGAPNERITNNIISSPGSVGMNLGDEHDNVADQTATSDHALVTNNKITAMYEGIWLTGTSNSTIMGNAVTQSGQVQSIPPSGEARHFPAGLTICNCAAHNAGTHQTTITDNTITSTATNSQYGVYVDTGQTGNTISHNDLFPNETAVQDASGGANTIIGNRAGQNDSLAGAPPVANAGPSHLVAKGSAVTLDGSGTRLMTGGATGVTYTWSQISGPTVTISNPGSTKATFTAPSVSTVTVLGFRLTATTGNGSTSDETYVGVGS